MGHIANVEKEQQRVEYRAGVLVLDEHDPRRVLFRTTEPVPEPETGTETEGIVPNVVVPTVVDDRGNGQFDVYFGIVDRRIGAVRLTALDDLPAQNVS